jgi:hypothetical protein
MAELLLDDVDRHSLGRELAAWAVRADALFDPARAARRGSSRRT